MVYIVVRVRRGYLFDCFIMCVLALDVKASCSDIAKFGLDGACIVENGTLSDTRPLFSGRTLATTWRYCRVYPLR